MDPNHADAISVDVAVIGGGPAGSTVASLLKKYNPELSVLILEKEHFPREHVGESQLPGISAILDEMGVWDKVEQAQFPIKIGASYTWGQDADLWDFDFYPAEEFIDEPRPAKFEGQRRLTAFQVDRAQYDEILLRHAEQLGTEVREGVRVVDVLTEGDRVEGFRLDTGETVTARHYIDASGHVGLIRRAMGVESQAPETLRNIAMWDYWDNAKWAIEIGTGGTRVQVRSLPYGWIWFIPLGPSRASVGLICPSSYYKERGLSPKALYHEALAQQPEIRELIADAKSETGDEVLSTKNWSQLADRLVGENWWLCGECAGFADPILAAGMTLAHTSAKEVAYSILELDRGELSPKWVRERYDEKNRRNIQQHIQFAEYWYAANGCFTDLQDHCVEIAKKTGLKLKPNEAWRWLAQGGFTTESVDRATFGSFDLGSSKQIVEKFAGAQADFQIAKFNSYKLNLLGAKKAYIGSLQDGRIERVECYQRGQNVLPTIGYYGAMIEMLKKTGDAKTIYELLARQIAAKENPGAVQIAIFAHLQALEAMITDGWVQAKHDPKRPKMSIGQGGGRLIRSNEEGNAALASKQE
ncbi:MAG: NAD(P)/FAD-dependent oxidoreductase [Planctomycetota bacterium]